MGMTRSVLEIILSTKKQGSGVKDTEKELGKLEKIAKKVTLAFIAMGAAKVIKSSTMLAARVETLGVVTKKLGENVNMTEREVRSLERAIVSKGITLQGSRQAIAMMIQANVDLAHATDLARLAQDTAVIANLNSSEAFQQLTYVLQTGNVRMARTLGLNVQFGKAQKDLAKELGKTTQELTEQEIMQARTNAVMKAGERIAGTYEEAMGTAGKTILSMERPLEELSRIFGEAFLPVLEPVVTGIYNLLNGITKVRMAMEDHRDEMTYGAYTYEEYYNEMERLTGHMEASAWVVDALTESEWNLARAVDVGATAIDGWNKELTDSGVNAEDASEGIKDLTEAQYFQAAAEALIAGNTALALHYMALGQSAVIATEKINGLIAAMQATAGMTMTVGGSAMWDEIPSYNQPGFEGVSSGSSENARKYNLWNAAHPSGMDSEGRTNPYPRRQRGGPVSSGSPYVVGEAGAELFVPSQPGNVYNQQQLAGGDININSGVSQRAFNDLAEDWMRGLGG